MGKYVLYMDDDYRQVIIIDKYCNGKAIDVSDLTPYAAPDLEQIRTEAYEKGYKAAKYECKDCPKQAYTDTLRMDVYQKGLSDAWEAARKVSHCALWSDYRKETGLSSVCAQDVLDHYSASEAIEKLKAYEQEKEAEIKVGDVVRVKNAPEVEIWVTKISDEDSGLLSGIALKKVGGTCNMGDTYANRNIYNFEHTGKHYDLPTVLEKMRGET